MNLTKTIVAACITGTGLALPVLSCADPLPPAQINQLHLGAGNGFTHPGVYYDSTALPGTYVLGQETATVSFFPSPSIYVHAGSGVSETHVAYATAQAYFRVNGPDLGPIPMLISTTMGASTVQICSPRSGCSNDNALAILSVQALDQASHRVSSSGTDSQLFSGSLSFRALATRLNYYTIDVNLGTQGNFHDDTPGAGSADGFIDPVISIDPSFAAIDPDYRQHYSIDFSPNSGNGVPTVSAVPEPETYALMLAGIGLIGAIARRKKQKGA